MQISATRLSLFQIKVFLSQTSLTIFSLKKATHKSSDFALRQTSYKAAFNFSNLPGRFEFVFTSKHGSWLNMIEMFFSKVEGHF